MEEVKEIKEVREVREGPFGVLGKGAWWVLFHVEQFVAGAGFGMGKFGVFLSGAANLGHSGACEAKLSRG
jgi:hypothetical protein